MTVPLSQAVTDNIGIFLLILGWLGVPAYFLYAWNRVGRDPPSPPVIPLFHPPEKLSPAALSYAHFNGFRSGKKGIDLPFIAALLSLGVKRFLQIDEDSRGTVTLQRGEAAGCARFAGAAERGRGALFDTSRQSRGDHPRQAQRSGPEECRDEAADGHIQANMRDGITTPISAGSSPVSFSLSPRSSSA
jgi:hypothetical protein